MDRHVGMKWERRERVENKRVERRGESMNVEKDEEAQAAIASTIVDCICKAYYII